MAEWVLVLAAFVSCLLTANAEVTLTPQSPSVSATPGRTVKITCTMSGGSISSYYRSWYMQKPGSAPVFVWYDSSTRGSGIPDRFTGSMDSSNNQMHLTITNAQREDAADYYCGVWYDSSPYAFTFGRGTKLNFNSPRKPAVSVLRPSAEEIRGQGTATLVCLVSGFNPAAVNIEWTVDGSTRRNGVETSRIQQDADNTFSTSSYLTLPASDWNSHERYSCVVKHETQATPFQTNIARSSCM
ncbi:immunoglobulin lambda-1 light chain-like [Hypanus sabinus]|uniref:immunoglobulin lambda-1 light chain-like n=1 Tax=Hypanus sabinus TaxID=79690 RepID=UPI0028C3CB07|nr:immunoglobulin lambda-1 light chain-like [Hypanus sabinus]XP_059837306.1 immunoglobulin lambda-1 light chain-like [Hypanus sabinus]